MEIQSDYVSFDVSTWIMMAAISHIIIMIAGPCCGLICCCVGSLIDKDSTASMVVLACCGCCLWILCNIWMIIGFILHSEMSDEGNDVCKNMVNAWSIIQATEVCCGPLFLCIGYASWDSILAMDDD